MGYGAYTLPDGREAGYLIEAACEHPAGCTRTLFRGLEALCGESPDGHRKPEEPGCGKYLCGTHEHDHDCVNPACGLYSADGDECCGLRKVHDLPHADAHTGHTFERTEDDEMNEDGLLVVG